MSDQGAPLKPFGRDELVAAVQRAADDHPRRARRALHRDQAERAIDVVLDEVLRQVMPVIEREWCGGEVARRIRGLRGAHRIAPDARRWRRNDERR